VYRTLKLAGKGTSAGQKKGIGANKEDAAMFIY
jgi:hypothetical protein